MSRDIPVSMRLASDDAIYIKQDPESSDSVELLISSRSGLDVRMSVSKGDLAELAGFFSQAAAKYRRGD